MTFGVPVEALPVTYQGELKTAAHLKWIQRRQVKEKSIKATGSFSGIGLPARGDVILRRGRIFHEHPGNVRMRAYIDMFQPEYKSAPLGEKANIASRIVETIKTGGGRFLERDSDGWWVLVSDKEAGKRVSKSIRSARTTMAVAENSKIIQAHQQESFFTSATEDRKKRAKLNHDSENSSGKEVDRFSCFFPAWKN
jgi:predicted RNA-binding protein with TRAM domain